jgi:hypothetical protein
MSWHPGTAVMTWYADNAQSGSSTLDAAASTPMTAEQLAWVNGMTNFAMFGLSNNTVTGYQCLLYSVSVYVAPALATLWTDPMPSGTENTAYSYTLTASGGIAPYTYTLTSGTLPTGLSLNGSTGAITGTPTVTASMDALTFTVTDSA